MWGAKTLEEANAIASRHSALDIVSADDPPIFILTNNVDQPARTRGIYNHHPLHAQLIQQRCEACGVEVVCLLPKIMDEDAEQLKSNPDIMMDFFFEHLGVSEANDD